MSGRRPGRPVPCACCCVWRLATRPTRAWPRRPRSRRSPGARASRPSVRSSAARCRCRSTTTSRTARRSGSRSSGCLRPIRRGASGRCSSIPAARAARASTSRLFAGPFLYTDEVRARFDLVGFDPRGILRSTTLRCFGTPRQWGPYFTPFAFPRTPEEEQAWIDGRPLPRDRVRAARRPDRRAHVDRERGARPRRAAAGGRRRQAHLRRLLVRLVCWVRPTPTCSPTRCGHSSSTACWTRSRGRTARGEIPFSTRLRSDAGAQATLDEFFRLCDARRPGRMRLRAGLGRPLRRARRQRSRRTRSSSRCRTADARAQLLDPRRDHARADVRLSRLGGVRRRAGRPRGAGRRMRCRRSRSRTAGAALARQDTSPSAASRAIRTSSRASRPSRARTATTRTPTPRGRAAAAADAAFGYFGPLWTWISSICAEWPFEDADRYIGPFNRATAHPYSSSATTTTRRPGMRAQSQPTACCRTPRC